MRLNLASRPFRNERLPNVLAVAAIVVALAASVWHSWVARDVLPDRTSSLVQALGEREAESARLRSEEQGLRAVRPAAPALAEWKRVKDIVDQRVFSWSRLFSVLEETLPDGVRLQSLAPETRDGVVTLGIVVTSRTHEEALDMIERLEARPEFEGVQPASRTTNDDGSIQLTCSVRRYLQQELPSPAPAAAAEAAPVDAPAAPSTPSTQAMR